MKILKWIFIVIAVLGIVGYFGMDYMKKETKKHSPEKVETYQAHGVSLAVKYCSPSKKGREIFGVLVPLNEVWRTGANEPTTFSTSKKLIFGGVALEPGTYSLWTIPQQTQWTIILNSEIPDWGVSFGAKASRNPEFDVLKVNAATMELEEVVEQFSINFQYNVNMVFTWDKTKVTVPIEF